MVTWVLAQLPHDPRLSHGEHRISGSTRNAGEEVLAQADVDADAAGMDAEASQRLLLHRFIPQVAVIRAGNSDCRERPSSATKHGLS